MTREEFWKKVEEYARWLCIESGKDPDSYYEEFDRGAALFSDDMDEVFPKIYAWKAYESEAVRAVMYFVGTDDEK